MDCNHLACATRYIIGKLIICIYSFSVTIALCFRYLRLPMLIRESTENVVPEVLEVLYRDTRVQDIHGALFLVLHRLMIETGFKVKVNLSICCHTD